VSDVSGRLLETEFVEEAGEAPSSGGRPATLLRFRDEAGLILGADLGASHVSVALIDLRGRILEWYEEPCDVRSDPDAACAALEKFARAALGAIGSGRPRLLGLGVAVAAPVDPSDPTTFPTSILPAWEGHTGLRDVASRLGVPLFTDNDANAGALAELWWGADRDVQHLTFVKIATGLGAGHVIAGHLHRGATGAAGELGHVSIDPTGARCICGNRGCVTSFVGTPALLERAEAMARKHPGSVLDGGKVTLDQLIDGALAGDSICQEVLGAAAQHLGTVLAGVLNIMNPSVLVLGGGLMRAGEHILTPVRAAVRERTLVHSAAAVRIEISTLGKENTALGAATLVLDHALSHPASALLTRTVSGR
jgi:predicted NBD/HSP70 family sugar kinase